MDKNYIKSLVQKILDKNFSNINKRTINDYNDRLNYACPYCGDSMSDYKKRGNLYYNRLMHVCFNCDKKVSFDKMCKDFDEQIDPDKKLEMMEFIDNSYTYHDYANEFLNTKYDKLIDFNEFVHVVNNLPFITEFQMIVPNGGVEKYLTNRGITGKLCDNIYQAKYWRNKDEFEWVIAFLNRKNDKIIGMQLRNLKEGKKRWFKIYNFENILEWINSNREDNKLEYDMNEIVVYNKLSYYYNILNVNFNSKITAFEGYIDSLFYPNSIGSIGVNTDYRFLESNDLDLQYFFDNDAAGHKKSEEKIKAGYPTFLWNKMFDGVISMKNPKDPEAMRERLSKIKDLNKLAMLVTTPVSKLKLFDYFSKDITDIMWIPKTTYKQIKNDINIDYNKMFEKLKF